MSRRTYAILALFLIVYVILTLCRPGGLMAYALPSICWATVALVTLYMAGGLEKVWSWTNKRIALMGLLVAVFQIFLLIDAGLITGFGKSPLSFTPTGLTINLIFVLSNLLGIELSRAYLMKNFGKKKPFLTLGLVTLLYTFITISIVGFLNILTLGEPLAFVEFFGVSFLPTLTANLLASYLALLGGPVASLAYRGPLRAFQWFSPILPNLSWGFETLLGVMAPTIGFMYINQATPPNLLRKIGIKTKTRRPRRYTRSENSSIKGWAIISMLCVLMVWASTGLLGFYPTIVASGSMRPTMDVGDIAMVIPVDPSAIKPGDIIQYWYEAEMTLHRVVETTGEGGRKLFVTKGDANTAPDLDPVLTSQIRGKLIFTIPKLGWISIYLKKAITNISSFFSTNITLAYGILTTLTLGIIIYAHKNRTIRKWKTKRRW
jgi:signal peptidase